MMSVEATTLQRSSSLRLEAGYFLSHALADASKLIYTPIHHKPLPDIHLHSPNPQRCASKWPQDNAPLCPPVTRIDMPQTPHSTGPPSAGPPLGAPIGEVPEQVFRYSRELRMAQMAQDPRKSASPRLIGQTTKHLIGELPSHRSRSADSGTYVRNVAEVASWGPPSTRWWPDLAMP